jgi:hypothetical protein
MTDAPSPVPTSAPSRFHPGWAFAAAGLAFAVAVIANSTGHATASDRAVLVALVLSSIALPGWVGVGAMIAGRPEGDGRAVARSRALTALTAVAMGLVLAGAVFALLYSNAPVAAYAFGATCLAMVFWVDRAS